MRRTKEKESKARKFLQENSLSIVLMTSFVLAFGGQMVTGWNSYNHQQIEHREPPVSFAGFLRTGTFWDGTFCNWQAAILQLAMLIVFSGKLYQRGAAHSRKPQKEKSQADQPRKYNGRRRTGHHSWIYRNSLGLAFWILFLILFALHLIFATRAYNENRMTQHLSPMSLLDFAISAEFWFLTLQTWEAEFFIIAVFIVLTIFLRQQDSPESKPPDASDNETGEPNK